MSQLGFFPGFEQVLGVGTNLIKFGAPNRTQDDQMISLQYQTGTQIGQLMEEFNQRKNNGTLTRSYLTSLRDQIQASVDRFVRFTEHVGTSRARNGARDISSAAAIELNKINFELSRLGTTLPSTPFTTASVGGLGIGTIALIGAGAYFILRK